MVEGLARFKLVAVDEQSARARNRIALLVKVAEQGEASVVKPLCSIFEFALETGNVVVDEFRCGGVVADDDEAWRRFDVFFFPKIESLFVVAIQGTKRGNQLRRQFVRVEFSAGAPALLWHFFANVLPEIAEHRHFRLGHIVGDRHPRQLDDAALDGVHQREIAHGPGEQGALAIARAAEEEGRGGEIDHPGKFQPPLGRLQAGNPQSGGFLVVFGFLSGLAGSFFLFRLAGLFAVAMVGFVVDREDVLHPHEFGHHPLEHLAFTFKGDRVHAALAFEQRPSAGGQPRALAPLEGVVVGDDDFCLFEFAQHVLRDEFAAAVVAFRVVGQQHPQAVADGDAGGDDQKALGEAAALGVADGVDRLPGDQHGHYGGFASAGCQLEGDARQLGVGFPVHSGQLLVDFLRPCAGVGRDFGEPDDGLRRFDLAKERADSAEAVIAPVVEQLRRCRRHLPLAAVGQPAPVVNLLAHIGNQCRNMRVLLLGIGQLLVQQLSRPRAGAFGLFRFRNGSDEIRPSPAVGDFPGGLAGPVEFPVAGGILVRRVENRLFEKWIAQGGSWIPRAPRLALAWYCG